MTFRDNYFADNRNGQAGYLGGATTASSSYLFQGNVFRGLDFSCTEIDPTATDPALLFGIHGNVLAAVNFVDNTWDGDEKLKVRREKGAQGGRRQAGTGGGWLAQ